jgi:predicted ATPase
VLLRRFILTGAPGSGKTTLLRQLEINGFGVVEEAATDLIALQQTRGVAEPWTDPSFLDVVVGLQRQREIRAASEPVDVQFHDRSVLCTATLANFLGFPLSDLLKQELERVRSEEGLSTKCPLRPQSRFRHSHRGAAHQLQRVSALRGNSRADIPRTRLRADLHRARNVGRACGGRQTGNSQLTR